jgi:large subunit ribosomal protein L5e
VQVVSPFQAILDYEINNGIPRDWVNFAISRSAPNGFWQRLERGELKLDEAWFDGFQKDLTNPALWEQYHKTFKGRRKLKDITKENPTQLGNSISLKAETSTSSPTDQDRGASSSNSSSIPPMPKIDAKWLFWEMMRVSRATDKQ